MKSQLVIGTVGIFLVLTGCGGNTASEPVIEEVESKNIMQQVDEAALKTKDAINGSLDLISILDHHRMAEEAGVYTPPALVTIFSDKKVNSELIQINQLIGLDLPYKVLTYSEPDTSGLSVAYTSAEFITKRYALDPNQTKAFGAGIEEVLKALPKEAISETKLDSVSEGFGIILIQSDFDFERSVQNIRDIVSAQSDTKWFGDINYQKEASDIGIEIRPTTILLFGGPAPGGKAMMTSPKIGLDAFCQKLLVYENEQGEVWVAFNDIVAFAQLYYQSSTKPQQMINSRLKQTFTKALKKEA